MHVLSKFIQTSFSRDHTNLSSHFYLIHPHVNVLIVNAKPEKAPSFSIGSHTRVFAWDPLLHNNWLTEARRPEHVCMYVCRAFIMTVFIVWVSVCVCVYCVKIFILFWGVCTYVHDFTQLPSQLPSCPVYIDNRSFREPLMMSNMPLKRWRNPA